MKTDYLDYPFHHVEESHMHPIFMPSVLRLAEPLNETTTVLDVGCGNGATAPYFTSIGCQYTGIDLSDSGIALARSRYPDCRFEILAAGQGLLESLNCKPFDRVISTEVVEHLYDPRAYAAGLFAALKPGGRAILTTPYHGYLKNLYISLLGKWDTHADPLWDCGHIKLWSRNTLTKLLTEQGFINIQFIGAGRLPYLWMAMIVSADKP